MKALKEIIGLFFKLGCIGFGGPAAHIAMMDEEVVEKRKWIDRQHFLDLVGATNLIPGPNSTEMTMHCGMERGGIKGLFAAGISFILPAVLITGFFAWLYVEYGHLPDAEPFIYGIRAAVLAIILNAVIKLGKKAVKSVELAALGVMVIVAVVLGVNEILALLGAGLIGLIVIFGRTRLFGFAPGIFFLQISNYEQPVWQVFLIFIKVGAVLYGSGYVLFAYLDAELVDSGLLARQELIDAVAVGQMTPGPVLSTATFIGYQLYGWGGAIAATVGIFLPSFLFVWLLNPLIPRMRKSSYMRAFLDVVNVAAVAVIIAVLYFMGKDTLVDWRTITIASIAVFVVIYLKKVNPLWIVLGGAGLGYLLYQF